MLVVVGVLMVMHDRARVVPAIDVNEQSRLCPLLVESVRQSIFGRLEAKRFRRPCLVQTNGRQRKTLRFAIDLHLNRDLRRRSGHGFRGFSIQEVDRHFVLIVIVEQLGVIFLFAEFNELPAVRPEFGVFVVPVLMIAMFVVPVLVVAISMACMFF